MGGIEFYIRFARTLGIKKYKVVLDKFRSDLKMERVKFGDLLYKLESRAGVRIDLNMKLIILKELLPSWAAKSFSNGVQEFYTILIELNKKLRKYELVNVGTDYILACLCH